MISKNYFLHRIACLQAQLLPHTACVISDSLNIHYFSGLHLSSGFLVITAHESFLITDSRYEAYAKQKFSYPIFITREYAKVLADVLKTRDIKTCIIDSETITWSQALTLQGYLHPISVQISGLEAYFKTFRMVKSTEEIANLKQSADILSKGFRKVPSLLKEGISEKELEWELEKFVRQLGADSFSFSPIVAFGANTALPHHRSGSTCLRAHDTVLIDMGVYVKNYASDATRVYFFQAPDPKMKQIYEIVKQTLLDTVAHVQKNMKATDLEKIGWSFVEAKGYDKKHSLGHGIGREVHEYPSFKNPEHIIEVGCVITLEPGIYMEGVGGVRLEDMFVMTESGLKNLTSAPL